MKKKTITKKEAREIPSFEEFTRKLVNVPKEEIDRKLEKEKQKKEEKVMKT